jgi:hypothetical protein
MNNTVKAIIVLIALATSACNTKQQTMAIYANAQQQAMQQQAQKPQITAEEARKTEYFIQEKIRADSTARLGCDPKFANCNIITGAN